jgi:hypothetical protein
MTYEGICHRPNRPIRRTSAAGFLPRRVRKPPNGCAASGRIRADAARWANAQTKKGGRSADAGPTALRRAATSWNAKLEADQPFFWITQKKYSRYSAFPAVYMTFTRVENFRF